MEPTRPGIDPMLEPDPHPPVLDDSPRKDWWGLGAQSQMALTRIVTSPGEPRPEGPSGVGYNGLVERGLAYARLTRDRGTIYFATIRGQSAHRAGTGRS